MVGYWFQFVSLRDAESLVFLSNDSAMTPLLVCFSLLVLMMLLMLFTLGSLFYILK